jgi:hypothetical protein
MMNKELKEKWISALESSKYKQGQKRLRSYGVDDTLQYCCLGVLCEVMDNVKPMPIGVGYRDPDGGMVTTSLSDSLLREAGLNPATQNQLIVMNDDRRLPFTEIAQWIRENL